MLAGLGGGPGGGVADREHRKGQPGGGITRAERFRCRSQPEPGGQVPGGQRGDGDAEVARGLAPDAVRLLRARGFSARPLEGGLPDWRLAGLPVAAGASP